MRDEVVIVGDLNKRKIAKNPKKEFFIIKLIK
jgi:hypothetical protein